MATSNGGSRRLPSLPGLRPGIAALAITVVGFPALVLLAGQLDDYQMHLAVTAAVWSVLVIGLNLTFGYAGQLNLAHGTFFGLGAYTAVVGTNEWGWSGGMVMAVALGSSAVAATVLGVAAFRARGFYLALITAGVSILAYNTFVEVRGLTGGLAGRAVADGLVLGPLTVESEKDFFLLAGGLGCLLLTASAAARRSGRLKTWEAIREDELLAASVGVNAFREKMLAFVLGAMVAAVVGVVFAYYSIFVSPDMFDFFHASFQPVLMLIVGGSGTLLGPVIGATLITVLPEALRFLGEYRRLVYAVALLVIILGAPRGIAGLMSLLARKVRQAARSDEERAESEPGSQPDERHVPKLVDRREVGATRGTLSVEKLTVRFAGLTAVDDVTFKLEDSQTVGIIGPNGAGKTTLINAMTGVVKPTSGEVRWNGTVPNRWDVSTAARLGVVRTFQNTRVFDDWTVRQNIDLAARLSGRTGDETLSVVGLAHVADRLASSLSYGEARRLAVAIALAADPSVLLLDEPGVGMTDAELDHLRELMRRLSDSGVTIVLIDHNMQFVMQTVDRVLVLDGGVLIADGTPESIQTDPAVIAAYLGGQHADR